METLASSSSTRRRRWMPNFITIHYCYFVVVCLLSSAVFWATSKPHGRISYVDSLFVVVSAMTEAGLNTVNLSTMTTWQQTMLFLLIVFGSTIWVSICTVLTRKHVFYRRFMRLEGLPRQHGKVTAQESPRCAGSELLGSRQAPAPDTSDSAAVVAVQEIFSPCDSVCALEQGPDRLDCDEQGLSGAKSKQMCGCEYRALELLSIVVPLYFVLWQLLGCISLGAWIHHHMPDTALTNGINPWWLGLFNGVSAFNNSGMSLLDANMMPFQESYFVLVTMGLMILAGNTAYPIFLRFIFWSGMKLLDLTTEATSFRSTRLAMKLLLKDPRRIYTNLFPSRLTWWLVFMLVCLNGIDWVLFEVLNLHNPAVQSIPVEPRVLVGLFQALAVRSGGFYVVPIAQISIAVQFLYVIMMYISVYPVVITIHQSSTYTGDSHHDMNDETHDASHSPGGGIISAASYPAEKCNLATAQETRSVSGVPPAQSFCHGPVNQSATTATTATDERPISKRSASHSESKHREKRPSLLPRPFSFHSMSPHGARDGRMNFIHQQIHGQLGQDIRWLVLAVLIIVIIESSHFDADPVNFSVFNVIFEVVSAYGTVGISVGAPSGAYSFAGTWYAGSKLVLCLVMLRGRHRGLPMALDRAIQLPDQYLSCRHDDVEEK
ncbi:High-affinity potassium transport protein [Beauveria bassiana]|uniref:High-affinity potassium transport protein n=1 Tax=Beauveria bassiana TaxID=176275 RepID=A0A2N6NIY4_BEABA|nr:High-affinity potassium transport protein [Beauveria bassiana]